MTSRNKIFHLLEIYEMLLEKPQTFHAIRAKIGIGYEPLNALILKLEEKNLVKKENEGGKTLYHGTRKLFELFNDSLYEGLKNLYRI